MNILDKQCNELDILSQVLDDISIAAQLKLVQEIYDQSLNGKQKLLKKLIEHCSNYKYNVTCVDGFIFELLLNSHDFTILHGLNKYCNNGIVPLKSDCNIDYSTLQKLLINQEFQKADQLTQFKLCELSRTLGNHSRDWLYFTDVFEFPSIDLYTIDRLWNIYSRGLFGISIQRKVWLSSNLDWEKFWCKIGWKVNDNICRYPKDFKWDITAPSGHLPLLNQLRGVQVMSALLSHPVWTKAIHDL
uniref:GUN4-like domain-containing protein n=1 Tax=Lympha mucosa TaxID=2045360 RepID=A0A6B9VQM8_9FLOR|nr:hypothetical protein [Lympha mucosa]